MCVLSRSVQHMCAVGAIHSCQLDRVKVTHKRRKTQFISYQTVEKNAVFLEEKQLGLF